MHSQTTRCLRILVLISTLFCFSESNAQFRNEEYQAGSIYIKHTRYVKNGVEYPVGFLMKNLEREMEVSRDAVIEFAKYKRNRSASLLLNVAALSAVITSTIVKDTKIQKGLFFAGVGSLFASLPFTIRGNDNLNKAIWIRNGDVLN